MTAADYFFILSAVYISHEMSRRERLWFGGFCIVAGVVSIVIAK
jgi:hypothetical protein